MKRRRERVDRPFLQRLKFKYRVSFLDENTLEEAWHVRLSRLSVFIYAGLFFLVTFTLFALIIMLTPLRYYLPGYGDEGNRETVIAESMRADSLQSQMNIQMEYLDVVKNIIAGDVKAEEVIPLDSFVVDRMNSLSQVEKKQAEADFVAHFEEEEKFNLFTGVKPNENAYVFFRPTKGVISKHYNPYNQFYGVDIITAPNENVLSVLDGTVIYTDFSFTWGWVIQVQHEGSYISIYKNNTRLLRKVGDVVKAGESIAITGDANQKDDTSFYFELWNQGNTINPEDVIIF